MWVHVISCHAVARIKNSPISIIFISQFCLFILSYFYLLNLYLIVWLVKCKLACSELFKLEKLADQLFLNLQVVYCVVGVEFIWCSGEVLLCCCRSCLLHLIRQHPSTSTLLFLVHSYWDWCKQIDQGCIWYLYFVILFLDSL